MSELFAPTVEQGDVPQIAGLSYLPNFISETDELRLSAAVDAGEWDNSWRRRRQLYGAAYGDERAVAPFPEWALPLVESLQRQGIIDRPFDQLLVNEYLPGQGITLHRDHLPFDRTVVSLSLLSACVMDFRHPATDRRASLLLERRSLLVLSDEARYDWQHGIARRKTDRWHGLAVGRARRVSITMRLRK